MGCDFELSDGVRCGKEMLRGAKCEEHKAERRGLHGDRRSFGSSDTPPSCGNPACHVFFDETHHHIMCPDRGPGWA